MTAISFEQAIALVTIHHGWERYFNLRNSKTICQNKQAWLDPDAALLWARTNHWNTSWKVYQCKECTKYHLSAQYTQSP